jgi:hypothetical protein
MPLPLLQTRISIDQVRCLEEGDGMGSAEPYVWLVFFKVDGERVSIGADAFAHGECQIVATDGSHGNLGSDDVDAGDILNVPHRIGEFRTSMRPIAFSEAPEREPLGGQIGAVMVLLEEDQVSDNGAKAGYAALTDFAKKAIDAKVNELHLGKQEVNEDEINALIDAAIEAVEAEIRSVQDGSQNFWSWVDGDDRIGVKVLRFNHKDLTNNYWDISERFRFLTNTGVEEEWLVLGEGQGVEPSPRGFAHQRRSQDLGTPSAAGSPSVTFHPSSGVQNTVYRDAEGRLHELWRDGIGQIGTTNLTAHASAPSARGNPFGYLETPTDQQIVVFRGDGGGVHALYWTTGAVGLDNLSFVAGSPAAAGSPVATYNPATNTHHVVYRSDDGRLHVMYWSGASDPVHYDGRALTDLVESPRAAGDPSAYFTPAGDNFVVYRATDSGIHSYYWSTGDLGHDPLSAVAGTPPAVGDPVAYYIPGSDLHQVTYRTGDGHLYELFSRGVERVSGRDLMADSGAPEAVSDPAAYYRAGANTKHVVYVGPFGHLFEISWVPGRTPTYVDLTLSALAPRAVDRPAAFVIEAALVDTHYVVYRGMDDQIHEISWTDSKVPRVDTDNVLHVNTGSGNVLETGNVFHTT